MRQERGGSSVSLKNVFCLVASEERTSGSKIPKGSLSLLCRDVRDTPDGMKREVRFGFTGIR